MFGFGRSTLAKLQENPHCTQMSEGNEFVSSILLDCSNHLLPDLGDASFKQNHRRNGTSINFTRVKVDGSFIKHQPVKQYLAQSGAIFTFRAKLPMAETVG